MTRKVVMARGLTCPMSHGRTSTSTADRVNCVVAKLSCGGPMGPVGPIRAWSLAVMVTVSRRSLSDASAGAARLPWMPPAASAFSGSFAVTRLLPCAPDRANDTATSPAGVYPAPPSPIGCPVE